ncbi:MAG: hypothetical protein M3M85_02605 [bacterium]|nr:hypothetical protein [bacterium]
MPKIKNILIFVAIAAVFVVIYIYFLKPNGAPDQNLISSPSTSTPTTGAAPASSAGAQTGPSLAANDFLTLLLGVKNIKLEDAIFSDPVFQGLSDSSIVLVPDGNEGRPNPFAPLGQDITVAPMMPKTEPDTETTLPESPDSASNLPINPAAGENPEGGAVPGDGTI